MSSAQQKFEPVVRQCAFQTPRMVVVNNVDAEPLANGDAAADKLVRQVCSPVLWEQSIRKLIALGHTNFVEVGPKKVLKTLMRKIDRTAKALSVEDTATLSAFLAANA
jgi:[acyl-carrier-protein] S-malonyltransferase